MSKCVGCGIELQIVDLHKDGYVSLDNQRLCMRCFQLKNYGKDNGTGRNNVDYLKILDKITDNDLVVYVSSLLTVDLSYISKFKNVILVLTKRDILPKSVKDNKIIKNLNFSNVKDIVVVSAMKKYNLDRLYNLILKYSNGRQVYFVGNTNSGKSTLINAMIKSYNGTCGEITVSSYPSTTLDVVEVKIGNILIKDTPGMVISDSIINYLDNQDIVRINSKKEIKPVNFQINGKGSILIDKFLRLDYDSKNNASITIYMANNLDIAGVSSNNSKLLDLKYVSEDIYLNNQDIVISDLGFIKITGNVKILMHYNEKYAYFIRNNLI